MRGGRKFNKGIKVPIQNSFYHSPFSFSQEKKEEKKEKGRRSSIGVPSISNRATAASLKMGYILEKNSDMQK